tara:strand:- start:6 stop:302 length:297 start_codon:yes stop_codon:yes gene_type:complete
MAKGSITYKGERKEVEITNRVLLQFEMNGGSFTEFEQKPVQTSMQLACSVLGLKGDILDHADDFLPLSELAEEMKELMAVSGFSDTKDLEDEVAAGKE